MGALLCVGHPVGRGRVRNDEGGGGHVGSCKHAPQGGAPAERASTAACVLHTPAQNPARPNRQCDLRFEGESVCLP